MTLNITDGIPLGRERKALALVLCALGALTAMLILHRPEGLLVIAGVGSLAWLASMLFNHEEPRGRQWKGILVPLTAGSLYAVTWYAESPMLIGVAAAISLGVLGFFVWFHDIFGSRVCRTWKLLFLPLAWSVSALLIVMIYYGLITPIGLILRTLGHDPMHRQFDRDLTSYWVRRDETAVDPEHFFRQF